ncbi:hypothetical protein [Ornithinimicrobium kibberense]|uniref:hypothetical protein n=1 Tax=Ornithinimicrobium kibberense TaxID=282060 RepID=UPI00360D088D
MPLHHPGRGRDRAGRGPVLGLRPGPRQARVGTCGSPTPATCGGRTPSSTRWTWRPSTTRTATGWATSRGWPAGSTTWRTWASPACG